MITITQEQRIEAMKKYKLIPKGYKYSVIEEAGFKSRAILNHFLAGKTSFDSDIKIINSINDVTKRLEKVLKKIN